MKPIRGRFRVKHVFVIGDEHHMRGLNLEPSQIAKLMRQTADGAGSFPLGESHGANCQCYFCTSTSSVQVVGTTGGKKP